MATYTAGELSSLNYVAESTYGTVPATALSWAGDIVSFKPSVDMAENYLYATGSRAFNATARGMANVGYSIECRARADASPYDWEDFWAVYGLGAAATTADHLGSFTSQVYKAVSGGSTYYNFYNGCKFDKFTIAGTGVGEPLIFGGDVKAQYISTGTAKTNAGILDNTIGANAAEQTGATIRWTSPCQINIAAGGLANFYPKNWKFTCDNHLTAQPGNRLGGDSAYYNVAVALDEGIRELTFECTLPHNSETYTNAKIAGSAITALTFVVGTMTVTLSNGVMVANDLPEYKHDLMEESMSIKFKSVAIA